MNREGVCATPKGKRDSHPGQPCRERQYPRAVHGIPRQNHLLTPLARCCPAAPSGWLSAFDRVVPDFLQLEARLMQQLVKLPDAGRSIAAGFVGKPAAHFLNNDHQVGQFVNRFPPFTFISSV